MPQGDKSKYTDKQKRKAEHIEEGYVERGMDEKEAAAKAWATVNAQDGGGKKPGGSGRKPAAPRTAEQRSASAKKAAATRKRNAAAKA